MNNYQIIKHTTAGHLKNGKRVTFDKQEVVMTLDGRKTGAEALRSFYCVHLRQTDIYAYVGKKVILGSNADTKYTAKKVTA